MQPQYGVLNYILRSLGLISQNVNWLSSTKTAMASVIVAAVWRQLPFMMVMLLAGLQTVPQDLIEAAVIDGAGKGQVFANITLPSIMSVIKTVTLTAIIGNFQMFTLFYNMTAGGPVRATTTLTVYTYETAFMSYDPVSYTHLSDVDIVRIAQRMFPPNSEYVSFSIPCRTRCV